VLVLFGAEVYTEVADQAPGVAAKQQVRSEATGLLPLRAVVVVEDDALGFEDADDIDRGLRVFLAGGFVYLDVDDDRFQIPASRCP